MVAFNNTSDIHSTLLEIMLLNEPLQGREYIVVPSTSIRRHINGIAVRVPAHLGRIFHYQSPFFDKGRKVSAILVPYLTKVFGTATGTFVGT